MNRKGLIEAVKLDTNLSEQDSTKLVIEILETITNSLSKSEKVDLRGFGIFSVTKRAARKARNIATGKIIDIPARNTVSFRKSETLKNKIKSSKNTQNLNPKTKHQNELS